MLTHLHISHYALIEQLDIDWHSGFSVITGETGAGKSIILGAIGLLLGGRADAKAIQSGQPKCCVEATFTLSQSDLAGFFEENDIDFDGQECIVRREVTQAGKSRAFINDTPVPATKLKELVPNLIDVHSQHQNMLIRNEHFLIDTLDVMAAQPKLLATYASAHARLKQARAQLHKMQERATKGQADREYLQFQLAQLDEARLKVNEQTDLEQEQHTLSHTEDIKQALFTARQLFHPGEQSITAHLRQAASALRAVANALPEAESWSERIDSTRIELDDIENAFSQQAEELDFDPQRLSFIEERLSTLYSLEQKHHVKTVEELIRIAEDLRKRLDELENSEELIGRQQQEVERAEAQQAQAAKALTTIRNQQAKVMAQELTESLHSLGMPHVSIDVQLTPRPEPDEKGADCVNFLFSANKNIPPQDVTQIASGGEIARLMLALKALIAKRTQLPTILFDEIDTGVSGNMAERMAQMMRGISEHCQVICITHLPQIAALGTQHYRVYKEDEADATRSHIAQLDTLGRVEEIAHLLSGTQISAAALENAKALLKIPS